MREFELFWARIEGNKVFGNIWLICMCFRCVKITFLLSEILMNLAYANNSAEFRHSNSDILSKPGKAVLPSPEEAQDVGLPLYTTCSPLE